jgi:hypothetical protein
VQKHQKQQLQIAEDGENVQSSFGFFGLVVIANGV